LLILKENSRYFYDICVLIVRDDSPRVEEKMVNQVTSSAVMA
jgi:hypothetical protein